MAVTLADAREWLRIDGEDNDAIIQGLLDAAPSYIEAATGLSADTQQAGYGYTKLCDTCTKFLLTLWYYGDTGEIERVQFVVDSLLKSIKALRGDWLADSNRY